MSLDIETRLRVFLASAPRTVRRVETLEISHPDMSQTFYLWRQPFSGTITTETGTRTVQPLNFKTKLAGSEANLDQNFEISLDTTDVEDTFREQMDLIPLATQDRVTCIYREYLSDDLTDIVAGPAVLQVEDVSYEVGAATLHAVSPRFNTTRTGEIYAPRDVPMLRGFL